MFFFFFFNDTATTEIYTLSLHDALPILHDLLLQGAKARNAVTALVCVNDGWGSRPGQCLTHTRRSEEHTSELQSRSDLVCRLLLEKKKSKLRTGRLVSVCNICGFERIGC